MKTRDFSFDLPQDLIAQFPADRREDSRLLCLDRKSGNLGHLAMRNLPELLPENSTLVINDSRVRKARVYGSPHGAGQREFLFLRPVEPGEPFEDDEDTRVAASNRGAADGQTWMVMTRRAASLRVGLDILLPDDRQATVVGHSRQFVYLCFSEPLAEAYFERHGHVPLPPYIQRDDQDLDNERYQTVYAAKPGSVAAPTAGLHLTDGLLSEVQARGIAVARVTLHVGLGTFLPVRVADVRDHRMHSEQYEVSAEAAELVNRALNGRAPVIAVGTTSVRTLESAFDPDLGCVVAGRGSTELFITPGYGFGVVSGMLTNFHTPESTLLMLVCAFAGTERTLAAYREAVERRYRFFSYGDGMLVV